MADEGTAEADDGPYEAYEAEESYEQEGQGVVAAGVGPYDEGEGPDIDEDNNIQPSVNNEVDVDEDNEVPNACGTTSTTSTSTSSTSSQSAKLLLQQQQQQQHQPMDTADVETSSTSSSTTTTTPGTGAATAAVLPSTSGSSAVDGGPSVNDAPQQPQIQSTTGSLGSGGSGTTSSTAEVAGSSNATTRQVVNPLSRQQQQAAHLMLMQQQSYEHEGAADDRIVPSTPTLYVPRRTDGFSEAVSSPHPQVPNARFTFGETSSSRQSVGVVPTSGGTGGGDGSGSNNVEQEMLPAGIDDTRIDLSQLDEAASGGSSSGGGRSVPTTPHHTTGESSSSSAGVISTSCVISSEAQASSLMDRSEKELLEEDDDDDAEEGNAVDDGVAVGAHEQVDDDVDVDMVVGQASASQDDAIPVPSTAPASSVGPGTSSAADAPSSAVGPSSGDDGVSSQGEKLNTSSPMEEGSEAEVLGAPSTNTRSLRSSTTTISSIPRGTNPNRRGRRPGNRGSGAPRVPITWQEENRGPYQPPYAGNMMQPRMPRSRGRRPRNRY
uniref:Uncharacterized protein n=1 Tax=Anopheles atroparvus TaxID=41427 RepID=A0A182IZN0_ANOAO